MRRLNVAIKQPLVLQTVKEFDAFPKVPDGFQETTATGGFGNISFFKVIANSFYKSVSFCANIFCVVCGN